ncbi:MAG: ABC transporter ATP-binding protein [Rhodospirillaceae bacterium]|jgi:branched-chain amino acid transport system ATP-binding protein|uniref:ABC transporter ATP-binding protein n=1 Tax=Hwanghaeella sp. 1Z406 TaxID=3402811 RepID=UPI000C69EE67|nr:ABC transporter ATP-binding protein [Rhodospirillales bacterium]MAX48037.1 ABC transporter ATP-binding protein [Rhodospirillaceae bacterium]|tara:strand:+ start:1896 stop:2597 length:702 start_codon:yes stop_codon:yes gene_type:complete
MLTVSGLKTFYGNSQALFGMTLEVRAGEVATLMGRNGMGKTTTVHSIMGIIQSQEGDIQYEGQSIRGLSSYAVARRGIGLVPEGRQIFPNLTAHENLVATAANWGNQKTPWTADRIYDLFPGLAARRSSMGNLLSGGEQQMLAVGRALMTNPNLLILDEATEGLAPLIRNEIWKSLEALKGEGLSILVIDKNVKDLARIGDRHHIVEKGRVVWTGNSQELLADEELMHRYLGV